MIEDVTAKKEEPEFLQLEEIFEAYCKMDPVSYEQNVELIPLSQSDKWLISARILDMVTLTTTDTGLAFFKFRKRAICYEEYLTYLKDLADSKNLNLEEMKFKMRRSGKPKREEEMPRMK